MARKSNAAVAATETAIVEAPKVSYPSTETLIAEGLTTKSARIRKLHELGMSIGDIARQETGGLYQHAYNVIKKPLKRPEAAVAVAEKVEEDAKQES